MTFIDRIKRRLSTLYWSFRGVEIGTNSAINPGVDIWNPKTASIGQNSNLGKNVSIYCGKNGSFTLGDGSHIAPFGYLLIDNNDCSIGSKVAVGPFCTFVCHSNSIKGNSKFFAENYSDGGIEIGNNVFIGAQCTILPGAQIDDNVVIASNSVVRGILKSGFVYGGTPVKMIKPISE
ncbi:DapH/DapD/GlmU-related protein [Cryomorphaceae bacterium 1068]|nr:DapH/DapD/GlmU-related protein [Cryomorphaceae bacterium 1068]